MWSCHPPKIVWPPQEIPIQFESLEGLPDELRGGDATAPGGPEGDGETESPGTHQFELNRD